MVSYGSMMAQESTHNSHELMQRHLTLALHIRRALFENGFITAWTEVRMQSCLLLSLEFPILKESTLLPPHHLHVRPVWSVLAVHSKPRNLRLPHHGTVPCAQQLKSLISLLA